MPQASIFPVYGIGVALVGFSCKADATVKRDGKSSLVTSVASGGAGIFNFTLATKFPRIVSATCSIEAADASPTDIVCSWRYDASTGIFTVYCAAAAVLTAPEAGSRVNVLALVAEKTGNAEV